MLLTAAPSTASGRGPGALQRNQNHKKNRWAAGLNPLNLQEVQDLS